MEVSIIIVNYNTLQMTFNCIKSVIQYSNDISYEIIVVDNASTDGSRDFFEKISYINYIYSDTNLGFGKANNLGVKHAKGKYIFFLNSDTILCNNAVQILSKYIKENPKCGVVGGNLYNSMGVPAISFERRFPGIGYTLNLYTRGLLNKLVYGKNIIFNNSKKPINVAYISGADLMMSKDLFESLDGFSNDFFMYYEETDLCYRVKKLGYKIQSVPEAQIIHLEGGSQKNDNINIWKISTMAHSRRVFMKRCHNIIYRLIDFGLMYFLLLFKYIIKPDNRQVAAEFKEFKQTL